MDAPDNKEQILRTRILKLTKRVGEAKKNGDFAEAENARIQRSKLVKQLIDQFNVYYWVDSGKSHFGGITEAEEFYNDPKNVKRAQGYSIIEVLLHDYHKRRARKMFLETIKDPETFRKEVLDSLANDLTKMQEQVNKIEDEIEVKKTDFSKIPTMGNDLEGIDFGSLSD